MINQQIILDIAPRPAPRVTHQGRFSQRALDYEQWKTDLWFLWAHHRPEGEVLPPIPFGLKFHIEMPPSWSNKKRLARHGLPHCQTPDLDNLQKAVVDALFPKKRGGDSHLWKVLECEKVWWEEGQIIIWW